MPARPQKSKSPANPPSPKAETAVPVPQQKLIRKAAESAPKAKAQRIDASGLTNRVRGHVSARTKRVQAKRDSR